MVGEAQQSRDHALGGRNAAGQGCAHAGSRDSSPAVGRKIESGRVDQAGRTTRWCPRGPGKTAAEVGASRDQ